jgi:3-oxoacyl-[acyl-carrier protein] reductase
MTPGSRIIFLSSSLTSYSAVFAEDLLYCVCKGAIEQMTRVLGRDLARRQINVNAVAPGPIDGEHFREGKSETLIDHMKAVVPIGRLGLPEDIADVIVFLCGEQSRFVTGQVIQVDGGMA